MKRAFFYATFIFWITIGSGADTAWTPLPTVQCSSPNPHSLPQRCDQDTEESLNQKHSENATLFPESEPCFQEARMAIKCCMNPNNQTECQYTRFGPPSTPPQGGTVENFNAAIETLVNESNQLAREAFVCKYFFSHCNKACKEKFDYYNENLPNFIGTADEPSFRQKMSQIAEMEKICSQNLIHKYQCLSQQGLSFRYDANKTLACSQSARQSGDSPQIICYRTEKGLEQCHYSGASFTGYADLGDPEQFEANKDDIHDYGILERRLEDGTYDSSKGHCSGTPVGDGSQIITAAHCLDGEAPFNTINLNIDGQAYTSGITCPSTGHYQGGVSNDTALCNLETPVPVKDPVFVMTYDARVPTGCVPEDYFLRCGDDAYLNLNNQPVQMISYPESQRNANGKIYPVLSQGVATFNPATGQFHTSVFGDYGSSGGGFLTEIDGRTVLVTNDSAIYYGSQQKTMPSISWDVIQAMQTELNLQKLAGGDAIFGVGP